MNVRAAILRAASKVCRELQGALRSETHATAQDAGVPSVNNRRVHHAGALRALLVKCSICFYHLHECFGRHSFDVLFAEFRTELMITNTQVDVDARARLGNAAYYAAQS